MSDLKVYTDKVVASAGRIQKLNVTMRDDFKAVRDAIAKLDKSWDSAAATSAIGKFNAIDGAYGEARYTVVDNFVAFLFQQVGEGYEQTEAANKSLADAFK